MVMSILQTKSNLSVPPIAWCPHCKRSMEIKSVRPGFRKNSDSVEFICQQCGTTKQENAGRYSPD
jgi:RNase P subunit RPR2